MLICQYCLILPKGKFAILIPCKLQNVSGWKYRFNTKICWIFTKVQCTAILINGIYIFLSNKFECSFMIDEWLNGSLFFLVHRWMVCQACKGFIVNIRLQLITLSHKSKYCECVIMFIVNRDQQTHKIFATRRTYSPCLAVCCECAPPFALVDFWFIAYGINLIF